MKIIKNILANGFCDLLATKQNELWYSSHNHNLSLFKLDVQFPSFEGCHNPSYLIKFIKNYRCRLAPTLSSSRLALADGLEQFAPLALFPLLHLGSPKNDRFSFFFTRHIYSVPQLYKLVEWPYNYSSRCRPRNKQKTSYITIWKYSEPSHILVINELSYAGCSTLQSLIIEYSQSRTLIYSAHFLINLY